MIWQRFAKELENMSNNLKEAFQAVNENIKFAIFQLLL